MKFQVQMPASQRHAKHWEHLNIFQSGFELPLLIEIVEAIFSTEINDFSCSQLCEEIDQTGRNTTNDGTQTSQTSRGMVNKRSTVEKRSKTSINSSTIFRFLVNAIFF